MSIRKKIKSLYRRLMPIKLYYHFTKLRIAHIEKSKVEHFAKVFEDAGLEYLADEIRRKKALIGFCGKWTDKYENLSIKIGYDRSIKRWYVYHHKLDGVEKLYWNESNDKQEVYASYKSLCMEQDELSPHRYITDRVIDTLRRYGGGGSGLGMCRRNFCIVRY